MEQDQHFRIIFVLRMNIFDVYRSDRILYLCVCIEKLRLNLQKHWLSERASSCNAEQQPEGLFSR